PQTLYGRQHNLITINLSEYQEAHSVSSLKGALLGYVDYGDAGVLTQVQGVGTLVAGPKAESAMYEVRNIRKEIQSRGQTHS
ncbi:hypothetical protein L2207_22495, partial [Xanthomonas perforans]|uniref:AAA family ATPase n=1 Tax=Xanthomonas perforans TaxID=442694 RepID=UPI001F34248C